MRRRYLRFDRPHARRGDIGLRGRLCCGGTGRLLGWGGIRGEGDDAQDGGVADAVSAFGFHFEEGNGLERERFATRPLGGIHYEAIHMPEPGTLWLGLAGMLVVAWKVWRTLASKG